jgi:CRP-like cAMP-binding protein
MSVRTSSAPCRYFPGLSATVEAVRQTFGQASIVDHGIRGEESRATSRSRAAGFQQAGETISSNDGAALRMAAYSSALAPIFRGKFCDILLLNRAAQTFDDDEVIYEVGDKERILFFIRHGVVKTGSITEDGREIIYDLRKDGDVVGELCAQEPVRRDRAVAIERTEAVAVPFDEVIDALMKHAALLQDVLGIFCSALSEAYDQVNSLAVDDVMHRLVNVLRTLARKFGRPSGALVEIATYLTQEELSQMVVARRERVSTALNSLRRRGIARYSARGHLLLDMGALDVLDPFAR